MGNIIKEKIIFSNSFNEAELLRTFAKNGINTLGVKVMNEAELCSYILMKNGITIDGVFLPDAEADFVYFKFLGGKFEDSTNMRKAINSFRDCVIGDALIKMEDTSIISSDFSKKRNMLINSYKYYLNYKKENNYYDRQDMINLIISKKIRVSDVECEYFGEMVISKLLLTMLKNVFNSVKEIYFSKYVKQFEDNIVDIVKTYGKSNELDYVLSYINDNNIELDKCQIVLTKNEDVIETILQAKKYNIDCTSAIGLPFSHTNPGILFTALKELKDMNYGVDGYKKLFNCQAFNKEGFLNIFKDEKGNINNYKYNDFIKYAGWLRLRFDSDVSIKESLYDSDVYTALELLKDSLKNGTLGFIKDFVIDSKNNKSVIRKMEEYIYAKRRHNVEIDDFDLLSLLLDCAISGKVSDSAKLHISGLDKAFSSVREYNFIIGLDNDYPGNPKENYLIYDMEYEATNSDIYISSVIIDSKLRMINSFIRSCEKVYLSYPFYSLLDLKEKNPSSIIFDELDKRNKKVEDLRTYGYVDSSIRNSNILIDAAIKNKKPIIKSKNFSSIEYDKTYLLNKVYSPSEFHEFFNNKVSFVLKNVFSISLDEDEDVYKVISARDFGTLVHKIMEDFEKSKITKEAFMDKAKNMFDDYLLMRPAIVEVAKDEVEDEFYDIIESLYETDPGATHIKSEDKLSVCINGINFKGKYDRLECNDGKYVIVDYKTGHSLKHKDEDIETCVQGLIYAYMVEEKMNIKIDRIEFRYPYLNKTISISYNADNKNELLNKIEEFKDAIDNPLIGFKVDPKTDLQYLEKYKTLLSLFLEVKNNA